MQNYGMHSASASLKGQCCAVVVVVIVCWLKVPVCVYCVSCVLGGLVRWVSAIERKYRVHGDLPPLG